MIQSPLNYTGGKYKLLPQILPFFPTQINTFVDLFCGGCNVGINVSANHIVFNDINKNIAALFMTFKKLGAVTLIKKITSLIKKFALSESAVYGYEYYQCNSSQGLAHYNKESFSRLKNTFNAKKAKNDAYYIMLYTLIIFSFNNQTRFNSKGEFNLPVGKRDFNLKMQHKVMNFIHCIQSLNCSFSSIDYQSFDVSTLKHNDFVYADPPYLITCASYNENGGWSEQNEKSLLAFLDKLHKINIRFALSNVLRCKGKENTVLLRWLDKNAHRYKINHLTHSYSNSNYQTKDRLTKSEEVLIINY